MAEETPIADVVLHPVRLKIIQQLGGRRMTTAQLREALPEVTQATLYRHVAALLDADVLAVVDERSVRGAVERTLALGERMAHVGRDELQAMDDVRLRSAFALFLGGLSNDFERILDHAPDEARGLLGFTRAPLYLDDQDLEKLQADLMEVLTPYLQERRQGQRRVSLATVLIPEVDG
ncbi:helix-turn-helix domain-containing protein [Microbacterium sp. gxy059]|uniref:helix-turn-helix domain-containing protein n=1 Tax=Microbacterium sp. gxy059 TaxID=2957199 RepID=UPI003D99B550